MNEFITGIKNAINYPKVKDLQKMFPSLNNAKINTIIRYLERSNRLVIDSDGYIIWIREENSDQLSLAEVANIIEDFIEHLNKRGINIKED
jgi:hypothetical protein